MVPRRIGFIALAFLFVSFLGITPLFAQNSEQEVYPVTVYYFTPLHNFSLFGTGKAQVDIELIRLRIDTQRSSAEIIQELDKIGYRPADICEVLAFIDTYPSTDLSWPIVGLSSVCRSKETDFLTYVPFLDTNRDIQYHLCSEQWWPELYLFAAVKKSSQRSG